MSNHPKAALIILDGWGIARNSAVSAIDKAQTPFVDSLYNQYPNCRLEASGLAVGLPEGQMGNSEVGHMNLGAGRVVYQDLVKINMAVADESIAQEEVLVKAFDYAKSKSKKVHFIGLLSDGGVHAHIKHLKGLIKAAHDQSVQDIYIHAFMDGRDTDPKGGLAYMADLETHLDQYSGKVASLVGRYYAMDRDKRWERVKKAYDLMVHGKGEEFPSAQACLEKNYAAGITDEFIEPGIIDAQGSIEAGDVVMCFNFRTDRGRQITTALSQQDFPDFGMKTLPLHFVTMTRYDDTFKGIEVIYEKDNLSDTLGEVLSRNGRSQVRIAETEKYPHVTFFFSGGREEEFEGEHRLMVNSPKVATYDLQPEMSAYEVRDAIIKDIKEQTPDFICLNFANPDMVGHTGVMEAAIKACETVDACAEAVVKAGLEKGYRFIILADHGNADCMTNADGSPNTAHTTQPVPCFLVGDDLGTTSMRDGVLGDVAPSILELMNVEQPDAMSGKSLLK
ncbi:MAG: 2,3-bisphosphoglycerate-independent phosphoglycerate mutase [Bacteroidetes bacterium]|nr:2,3-bisphosphoglycerate-independent phosphoglycerate mutase [Bacteroidota bacterium]